MLGYCQFELWEQTSVKFYSKYQTFHSRKCIWTHHLRDGGHLVQGADELIIFSLHQDDFDANRKTISGVKISVLGFIDKSALILIMALHGNVVGSNFRVHYNVIWTLRHLQLPVTWWLLQTHVLPNIKENIIALHYCLLVQGDHGYQVNSRWILHTKGQWYGNRFHVMTSSCLCVSLKCCQVLYAI